MDSSRNKAFFAELPDVERSTQALDPVVPELESPHGLPAAGRGKSALKL